MIVCMCNRLSDGKVRAAIEAGAQSPAEVFKKLGVPRACGNCMDSIRGQIAEHKSRQTTGP
jgi:bacterioferritin-associated ferredoxin